MAGCDCGCAAAGLLTSPLTADRVSTGFRLRRARMSEHNEGNEETGLIESHRKFTGSGRKTVSSAGFQQY